MGPSQTNTGRVFIALWPPASVAEQIGRGTSEVVRASRGRAVHVADLHVTLAFLGQLPEDRVVAAETALAATDHAALTLLLDRLGCFRRAQVLWLAPSEPPPALLDLHALLWVKLEAAGFSPERRAFKPHMTLARRSRPVRRQPLEPAIEWRVASLVLAASSPGEPPPRYRQLAVKALRA